MTVSEAIFATLPSLRLCAATGLYTSMSADRITSIHPVSYGQSNERTAALGDVTYDPRRTDFPDAGR